MAVNLFDKIVINRPQAQEHLANVQKWRAWYVGYVKDFHSYYIYNGRQKVKRVAKSLQMGKKVSEDWADLLFNEQVKIALQTETDTERLAEIREELGLDVTINQAVEKCFALGTVGLVFSLDEHDHVMLSTVEADQIFPITYENGKITECAFVSTKLIRNEMYAYITVHQKDENGKYVIENALYKLAEGTELAASNFGILGDSVSYWTYPTESEVPWFAILKPNCANNTDSSSPWGVSVFANAISEMKVIDNTFDAIDNEVSNGRMRIMVSADSLNYSVDGAKPTEVFDARETVFHQVPKDTNQPTSITTVAPTLRTVQLIEALNNALASFARKCGMSSEQYVYKSGSQRIIEQTATEVISNNSPMYRRMIKHEILLKQFLIDVVKALSVVYAKAGLTSFDSEKPVIEFDDSIVTDTNVIRSQELRDVESSILTRAEYRARWYGEDIDTAQKYVDKAIKEAGVVTDTREVVRTAQEDQSAEK